ncbi:hypothetical protein [Hymenobacter sp. YC55]|uniref:hypothetical protein n=1 Tax=Hymenobacter sp. YC55 TaxID=3034019 RepID=UPI0023F82A07|nr:hypothetical protein [Hymenobacter sp. YC55]MDF7815353.1 hypothetical protein [Hymenobacter sp. YC55]
MRILETTRWYFGDSRQGFPPDSLAHEVHRQYRLVRDVADMVLELAESTDQTEELVTKELKRRGYSYQAEVVNSHPVKTEISTPTHLIRILGSSGTRRVETAGQEWGGENEDWLEAQVFHRPTFDDDQDPSQPDKYALPTE